MVNLREKPEIMGLAEKWRFKKGDGEFANGSPGANLKHKFRKKAQVFELKEKFIVNSLSL